MTETNQETHAPAFANDLLAGPAQTDSPVTSVFKMTMAHRQEPLVGLYDQNPEKAWVYDDAVAGTTVDELSDPLHSNVSVAGFDIPIGVHQAVGGDGDAPVPGEILSAALASCLESSIRIIANRLNIELTHLTVSSRAGADVRGTLRLNRKVPVGFQRISVGVDIGVAEGTSDSSLSALLKAAETSCVVMQTLRTPPAIVLEISRRKGLTQQEVKAHA